MFQIGIDGIILSQVAELIHPVNEDVVHRCKYSYKRSLEDLAFAIVYGQKILKSGSLRPTNDPKTYSAPHLLSDIDRSDSSILDNLPKDDDLFGTRLLEKPEPRTDISEDLRVLEDCVRSDDDKQRFIEWLVREATLYFGKDDSVFEEKENPADYVYGHDPKYPYHTDRELQGSIAHDVISILDAQLPRSPKGYPDPYSRGARVEFITRNMLSLVTIMRSFELSADRHDLWRLPHVTRACIRLRETRTSGHHLKLRGFVVSHALFHALKRTPIDMPKELILNLCDLRADPKIADIRQLLGSVGQLAHSNDPARDQAAREINRKINSIDLSSNSEEGALTLAERSALRELRSIDKQEYEDKLFHVFEQLKPVRPQRGFVNWPGANPITYEALESALADFSKLIATEKRMTFWSSAGNRDHKWVENPESHGRNLLHVFLKARFGDQMDLFLEIAAGAGRIDLYLKFGKLSAVVELKMCGKGYSSTYAAHGEEQIVHYLENRDTSRGYLVIFDARMNDFGTALLDPPVSGKFTIGVRFVDVRPQVRKKAVAKQQDAKKEV